ncbi:uncharacterized protein [Erythrolamprus reginae]|uniref:uncharacterized protein isoform X5 n=1 Tax=Erythrolamprus reginae TaxID=121349 RepID=UPI00396CA5CB
MAGAARTPSGIKSGRDLPFVGMDIPSKWTPGLSPIVESTEELNPQDGQTSQGSGVTIHTIWGREPSEDAMSTEVRSGSSLDLASWERSSSPWDSSQDSLAGLASLEEDTPDSLECLLQELEELQQKEEK